MNRIILLLALVTGCWTRSSPTRARAATRTRAASSALQTAPDANTATVETDDDAGSGTLVDAGVEEAGDAGN